MIPRIEAVGPATSGSWVRLSPPLDWRAGYGQHLWVLVPRPGRRLFR
jgi:hypothetical protein